MTKTAPLNLSEGLMEMTPRAGRHDGNSAVTFFNSCSGVIGEVEDDYCEDDLALVIEAMDDDLVKQSMKNMYELENDKSRLIADCAKKSIARNHNRNAVKSSTYCPLLRCRCLWECAHICPRLVVWNRSIQF